MLRDSAISGHVTFSNNFKLLPVYNLVENIEKIYTSNLLQPVVF